MGAQGTLLLHSRQEIRENCSALFFHWSQSQIQMMQNLGLWFLNILFQVKRDHFPSYDIKAIRFVDIQSTAIGKGCITFNNMFSGWFIKKKDQLSKDGNWQSMDNNTKVVENVSFCLSQIEEACASSPKGLNKLSSYSLGLQATNMISAINSGSAHTSLSLFQHTRNQLGLGKSFVCLAYPFVIGWTH